MAKYAQFLAGLALAFALVEFANANFISHPHRFMPTTTEFPNLLGEQGEHRERDTSEPEGTQYPHHGFGRNHGHGGRGHGHGHGHGHGRWHGRSTFPQGIQVDESTLEHLRIRIKQELESGGENSFHFEETFQEEDDEDLYLNWDEDHEELPLGDYFDGSIGSKVWKRELGLSRILIVAKNGTKSFFKTRDSSSAEGSGDISVSGSLNTTLNVKSSGSGDFSANITYSSKGKDTRATINGDASSEGSSSSKLGKDRLYSKSSVKSSVTIDALSNLDSEQLNSASAEQQNADPITVSTVLNSKSETFAAPFRSYLSIFGWSINTTTTSGKSTYNTSAILKGEATSHVIHTKNGTSLTRLKVKAFMTSAAGDYKQLILIKAKTHIWTKIVSLSENGAVVDVYSFTKTRAYGKGGSGSGADRVYSGTGTVTCEKTQLTISAEDADNLHIGRSGLQIIHSGIAGNAFSGLLSSSRM